MTGGAASIVYVCGNVSGATHSRCPPYARHVPCGVVRVAFGASAKTFGPPARRNDVTRGP